MDEVKGRELKNCNTIKTVLMLSVVLYHSMLIYASDNWFRPPVIPSEIAGGIAKWMNSFLIYAFTLVSGYIFYYVKFERGGYQKYIKLLWNKFQRLIIPYIVVTALWAIPVYLLFFKPDIGTVIRKFVIADSPEQLWFLLMLFWVFAIFGVMAKWMDKHPLAGIGCLLVLYLVGTVWNFTLDFLQIFNGLRFAIFFGTGFLMRKYGLSRLRKIPWPIYVVADILIYIVYIYSLRLPVSMMSKVLWMGLQFVVNSFGAIMAFVSLQWISDRTVMKKSPLNLWANIVWAFIFCINSLFISRLYCLTAE